MQEWFLRKENKKIEVEKKRLDLVIVLYSIYTKLNENFKNIQKS